MKLSSANSHYEKILATGEVKCIDDEIQFEIPNTWEWIRISSVIDLLSGRDLTPTQYNSTNQGIPYMTGASNFENGQLIVNRWTSTPATISKKGDLLITCKGTIGEMAYNNIGEIHIARQIMSISSNYIELPYVKIFLSTLISILNAKAKSIIPGISRENILDAILPLPPLNEQKRISLKIEEIQPLIEKYRVVQEQAEGMDKSLNGLLKKSVLQYAIQGKLVPQIENEESASILLEKIQQEKLRLVNEGKLKKKDLDNSVIFKGDDNKYYEKLGSNTTEITEEIPYELPINWTFVRLSNLCWLDDGIKASGEKLPYLDAKYHRRKSEITYLTQGKVVEPPYKVILVDGENSGEIFNITEKGYLGSTFKVLQISKCISEEWLHILLDTYRDLFKNSKIGAAIPHLNKNLFRNLFVGLPPIEEQQRITNKIEKLIKGIEGI